jgi:hypothetical protein
MSEIRWICKDCRHLDVRDGKPQAYRFSFYVVVEGERHYDRGQTGLSIDSLDPKEFRVGSIYRSRLILERPKAAK